MKSQLRTRTALMATLTMASDAPIVPASPTPFTPGGFAARAYKRVCRWASLARPGWVVGGWWSCQQSQEADRAEKEAWRRESHW